MTTVKDALTEALADVPGLDTPRFRAVVLMAEMSAEAMDDLWDQKHSWGSEDPGAKQPSWESEFNRIGRLLLAYMESLGITPKAAAAVTRKDDHGEADPATSAMERLQREATR